MAAQVRVHVIIHGKVQGVFFRMKTREEAIRNGVTGWVRNLADGTVEAVFEGNEAPVKMLLKWCENGPPHAKVSKVDVRWESFERAFAEFDVTY